MSLLRTRAAVAPLRRRLDDALTALPAVDALVAVERPEEPMHCLRPAAIAEAASGFVAGFPGEVLYAVKCNPEPAVLRAIWAGGVRHFDCASANEVALVRSMFPEAGIHFMHPIKARGAIRAAWGEHGVQDFVLDSAAELDKILAETGAGAAEGLGLFIRLGLPKGTAMLDLSGKFGAEPEEAAELLRAARPHAARLGLCFHVGSQMMDPLAWRQAMALAGEVIAAAGVPVEVVDVGGGFPVAYPGIEPPPLGAFFAEIEASFEALDLPGAVLWAEPGRALVAGGGSVVVQVQGRRGRDLYLNDGVYGALSDAGVPGFTFPVRLIRPEGPRPSMPEEDFVFFGPTCDSADRMKGPFPLPEDVREGDWIEIGQLGAYGACLRTAFNGFDRARLVEVRDRPMLEGDRHRLERPAA
ncbi:type III PLP-dependent enzyme [Belnapia rosea]|uniref:type III PLP-dependent enzyme n=1 Tax=Belnapia rosea TaxID=938405 RepID=UPI00087FB42C|nr:type III PLP-dependent enzyme [Belnapia rosea]SDB44283.1 ornithine decarboxylase [Belnapia rosea]